MAYPAEACPGFQSIKRLWVLLLSLDGMPVRHKAPALHFISLPWPFVGQGTLYTRGWWDAVRLKCVAREQNTKPDRASNPQPYGLTLGLNGSPKKLTCIDSIHYLLSVEFAAPDPSQQRCFLRSSFLPQISGQHIIQRTTACHPPPRHRQRLHRWHQSIRVLFGQVRSLAWPGPGCVKSVIKRTVPATLKHAKMIVWTLFLQGTVKSSCVEGKCRRVIFGVHFGKFTNQAAVFFLELLKRQNQVGVSLKICNHRKIPAITPPPHPSYREQRTTFSVWSFGQKTALAMLQDSRNRWPHHCLERERDSRALSKLNTSERGSNNYKRKQQLMRNI